MQWSFLYTDKLIPYPHIRIFFCKKDGWISDEILYGACADASVTALFLSKSVLVSNLKQSFKSIFIVFFHRLECKWNIF